jgi:hypothetical protein
MFGAGDGTRTRNLLITSQLLYQLSYASTSVTLPKALSTEKKCEVFCINEFARHVKTICKTIRKNYTIMLASEITGN